MSLFRKHVAVALALALAMLAASPAWHHDHEASSPDSSQSAGSHGDESRLFAGAVLQPPHPARSCPICFSHRLLSQTSLQVPLESARPSAVMACRLVSSIAPKKGRSSHVESRAPPVC